MGRGSNYQCAPGQLRARNLVGTKNGTTSTSVTEKHEARLPSRRQHDDSTMRLLLCQLPRELRNHIYTFCVRGPYDNEVFIRRPTVVSDMYALLVRQPTGHGSYRWAEDAVHALCDVSKLGYQGARELLEAYYWSRTFKCSHRELSVVGPFLQTDRYGLGLTPGCFMRRLQLQIQADMCSQNDISEARSAVEEAVGAIKGLGNVLTLRTEVSIDVSLPELVGDREYALKSSRIHDLSREVEKAVESLRAKGLRVALTYNKTWCS
ncbi:hypothetical protein ACEQ8H_005505 [Pleosporales sp. CAS-2024a]